MNPARELCPHLASETLPALPLAPDDVLEAWDGPAVACARCAVCAEGVLLVMVAWRPGDRVRVFSLAGIDPADVAVYRRNVARGSCDLARFEQETAALHACAGPVERLVALDVDTGRVLASAPRPADWRAPAEDWDARCVADGAGGWYVRLGVGPATASAARD
ncbi:MAG TPA: hypothetical protein ENO23_05735 [Alphaproteobacteria bacterium]|nr:hypothetical protein [Alphaproteobacteria bacterium]